MARHGDEGGHYCLISFMTSPIFSVIVARPEHRAVPCGAGQFVKVLVKLPIEVRILIRIDRD